VAAAVAAAAAAAAPDPGEGLVECVACCSWAALARTPGTAAVAAAVAASEAAAASAHAVASVPAVASFAAPQAAAGSEASAVVRGTAQLPQRRLQGHQPGPPLGPPGRGCAGPAAHRTCRADPPSELVGTSQDQPAA